MGAALVATMTRQQTLGFELSIPQHVYEYGDRATGEMHGVVLTKPYIVQLILDLARYKPTRNLTKMRLLEPSCGEGVFLKEAARRLLESAKQYWVLRFQAQYLRRIRVPDPSSLAPALKNRIRTAFRDRDFKKLDSLALQAYGLEILPEFSFVDTRK